ncbi:MAG: chemotaxis protein CheW [Acidobacteriota bacterium]
MNKEIEDSILDESFLEEKNDFAEIDFSSLLDLPGLNVALNQNQKGLEGEKYIVFQLDEKFYGISSKSVSEVAATLPVTSLPNVPEWVSGIANLRGDVISVVDLRKLWGKHTESPPKQRLLIFHSAPNDSPIAIVVDRVNEMISITQKEINFSAEDFTASFPTFFGRAEFKSQPLFLLDIDKMLSSLSVEKSNYV